MVKSNTTNEDKMNTETNLISAINEMDARLANITVAGNGSWIDEVAIEEVERLTDAREWAFRRLGRLRAGIELA